MKIRTLSKEEVENLTPQNKAKIIQKCVLEKQSLPSTFKQSKSNSNVLLRTVFTVVWQENSAHRLFEIWKQSTHTNKLNCFLLVPLFCHLLKKAETWLVVWTATQLLRGYFSRKERKEPGNKYFTHVRPTQLLHAIETSFLSTIQNDTIKN